jgi:hypothetical protein
VPCWWKRLFGELLTASRPEDDGLQEIYSPGDGRVNKKGKRKARGIDPLIDPLIDASGHGFVESTGHRNDEPIN